MNPIRVVLAIVAVLLWSYVSGFVLPFGVWANTVIGFLGGALIGSWGFAWASDY